MMPNDPEIFNAKIRRNSGIPLDNDTLIKMKNLSKRFNVRLKFLN